MARCLSVVTNFRPTSSGLLNHVVFYSMIGLTFHTYSSKKDLLERQHISPLQVKKNNQLDLTIIHESGTDQYTVTKSQQIHFLLRSFQYVCTVFSYGCCLFHDFKKVIFDAVVIFAMAFVTLVEKKLWSL